MKMYSSKANANRAAKTAQLINWNVVEREGKFGYVEMAPADPILAPLVKPKTKAVKPVAVKPKTKAKVVKPDEAPAPKPAVKVKPVKEKKVTGKKVKEKPVKEKKVKPVIERRHKSDCDSPVQLVHSIANDMLADDPDVTRKDILQACDKAGIAFYTVRTQYQRWNKARKEEGES